MIELTPDQIIQLAAELKYLQSWQKMHDYALNYYGKSAAFVYNTLLIVPNDDDDFITGKHDQIIDVSVYDQTQSEIFPDFALPAWAVVLQQNINSDEDIKNKEIHLVKMVEKSLGSNYVVEQLTKQYKQESLSARKKLVEINAQQHQLVYDYDVDNYDLNYTRYIRKLQMRVLIESRLVRAIDDFLQYYWPDFPVQQKLFDLANVPSVSYPHVFTMK